MNCLVARTVIVALLLVTWGAGCRGVATEDEPIVPIRNMYDQPRYDTQGKSDFFDDGRVMRPTVKGTVAREMPQDIQLATGRKADDSGWLLDIPPVVFGREPSQAARQMPNSRGGPSNAEFLAKGKKNYNIYCAPCHAPSGLGDGLVMRRAHKIGRAGWQARSLHDSGVRSMPDGQIFATISNGVATMPGYKQNIPVADRWAIVAYVRSLQSNPTLRQKQAANEAEKKREMEELRRQEEAKKAEEAAKAGSSDDDVDKKEAASPQAEQEEPGNDAKAVPAAGESDTESSSNEAAQAAAAVETVANRAEGVTEDTKAIADEAVEEAE